MLTEPQIQRYARQLLLRDVGERGQEALGAVQVALLLDGAVGAVAAAYLRAGGTEVHLPAMPAGPWAFTPALVGAAPRATLEVVAGPRGPESAGLVVGSAAGAQVLWSIAADGCRGCLRQVTRGLGAPEVPDATSVQLGSLVALLVQRRALGVAAALEGLEISSAGVLSTLAAPACAHRPPSVPAPVLAELVRQLSRALPDEGCAVLLGRGDQVRLVPMENAQGRHHARDPEAFPRTARTAFSLDPRAWLALLREADRTGEQILAIAHSHPEGGASFSAEDRRWTAPDGQLLLPGVAHLVIAFQGAQPSAARWALWADGDFLEAACPLDGT
ncbi:MAG TPA: Mov34/MPN/PAD-1 family protein [Myxococcaceae bacterium]|nr:Mov34/MPN/PAD-1 family protein [Myxococcaceae bacterium]